MKTKKKKIAKKKTTKAVKKAPAKKKSSAKVAIKVKAKAKAKPASKVKAKTKAAPKKKSAGLTVQDLFRMKQEKEQAALNPDWQHKKDLPEQDHHSPEDAKDHGSKKSGFGGARHH